MSELVAAVKKRVPTLRSLLNTPTPGANRFQTPPVPCHRPLSLPNISSFLTITFLPVLSARSHVTTPPSSSVATSRAPFSVANPTAECPTPAMSTHTASSAGNGSLTKEGYLSLLGEEARVRGLIGWTLDSSLGRFLEAVPFDKWLETQPVHHFDLTEAQWFDPNCHLGLPEADLWDTDWEGVSLMDGWKEEDRANKARRAELEENAPRWLKEIEDDTRRELVEAGFSEKRLAELSAESEDNKVVYWLAELCKVKEVNEGPNLCKWQSEPIHIRVFTDVDSAQGPKIVKVRVPKTATWKQFLSTMENLPIWKEAFSIDPTEYDMAWFDIHKGGWMAHWDIGGYEDEATTELRAVAATWTGQRKGKSDDDPRPHPIGTSASNQKNQKQVQIPQVSTYPSHPSLLPSSTGASTPIPPTTPVNDATSPARGVWSAHLTPTPVPSGMLNRAYDWREIRDEEDWRSLVRVVEQSQQRNEGGHQGRRLWMWMRLKKAERDGGAKGGGPKGRIGIAEDENLIWSEEGELKAWG